VQLAAAVPDNLDQQRELAGLHDKVGKLLEAQGNQADALKSYQSSLAIRDHLAKLDAANADAQHDLSVSLNSVGDALVAQGNLADALRTYQSRHAVLDRLAKLEPGNDTRQYELAMSYGKLANTYRRLRQTTRIRENLNAGRGILARLVAQHPEETQWKRDLADFDRQIARQRGQAAQRGQGGQAGQAGQGGQPGQGRR
jgi:tetratricopeptide (TPR) repeat protein